MFVLPLATIQDDVGETPDPELPEDPELSEDQEDPEDGPPEEASLEEKEAEAWETQFAPGWMSCLDARLIG